MSVSESDLNLDEPRQFLAVVRRPTAPCPAQSGAVPPIAESKSNRDTASRLPSEQCGDIAVRIAQTPLIAGPTRSEEIAGYRLPVNRGLDDAQRGEEHSCFHYSAVICLDVDLFAQKGCVDSGAVGGDESAGPFLVRLHEFRCLSGTHADVSILLSQSARAARQATLTRACGANEVNPWNPPAHT